MFIDRTDAGKRLADELSAYKGEKNTVVIALPRGGVVVGGIISKELKLPLDIVVTRKIGYPTSKEYAIGAVAESGEAVWNEKEISQIDKNYLKAAKEEEAKEADRRIKVYRKSLPDRNLKNKTILLVDDGLATGLTIRAAVKTIKKDNAGEIIIVLPCAPKEVIGSLRKIADKVIVLYSPSPFFAVGNCYLSFNQVSDKEVIEILNNQGLELK